MTISRVISIIEAAFVSAFKLKQKTTLKEFMCYNCDKIGYYKKSYTIQDQIDANKKVLKKVKLHCVDIDDE